MKLAFAVTAMSFSLVLSSNAFAQNGPGREGEAPPAATYAPPPPPNYAPPPYGYGYGQPQYAQPQGPKRMSYDEGDPVPPGYHVATRTRTGLLIAGGIVFGVFYGLTAAGAGSTRDSDAGLLYVPVVGPVLYGSTLHGEFAGVSRFFLWIDAFAQAGGAAMLIAGFVPKTELVRNDIGRVYVQPLVAAGGGGIALAGLF